MIFDQTRPESQYYIQPKYATGFDAARLDSMGYNPNGTLNTRGQIASWIPGVGLASNFAARNYARKHGITDSFENIQEDTDNQFQKIGTEAGIGLGIAGAVTGNPQLIGKGLNMAATFGGQLAFDQQNVTDGEMNNYIYQ